MSREVPCDLFALIDSWTQTVSQHADYSVQAPHLSPRTLRPRPTPRPQPLKNQTGPLAPTSGNPRVPKRAANQEGGDYTATKGKKRAKKMPSGRGKDGHPAKEDPSPVREAVKRGRPPGSKTRAPSVMQSVMSPAPVLNPSPTKAGSRSKPGSPKRAKSRTGKKIDSSIDLDYIESCYPSVLLMGLPEVLALGPIPHETLSLYQQLNDVPFNCIPAELKAKYDQEQNSSLESTSFLPPNQHPFPPDHLLSLKYAVDLAVKRTVKNNRKDVHERQWGTTTVSRLIHELETWPELQHCELMNVESCAVEPVEIRMERPDGKRLEVDTVETHESASDSAPTTTRMVDFSIGLTLKREDEMLVKEAFSNMSDHDQSLNQSLSWIRAIPLILDIELKRVRANREPTVQLAIWKAGAYRKMLFHQWDLTMPMPGITVDGSKWELYLFFPLDPKLIMMGPIEMGTTNTVRGTFEIVYKLYVLLKWGKTHYEPWFKKHILQWCKHKADRTIAENAGLISLHI